MFRRDGLDPVTLVGWKKVARVDQETGDTVYVYVGPHGQNCADLDEAFAVYDSSVDLERGGPGKKSPTKVDVHRGTVEDSPGDRNRGTRRVTRLNQVKPRT